MAEVTNAQLARKSKELMLKWLEHKATDNPEDWTEGEVKNFKEILRVANAAGSEADEDELSAVSTEDLMGIWNVLRSKTAVRKT